MNVSDQTALILSGLEPMFKEADATGKWFHCSYQDLWFSPAELRAHHAKGKFLWGAVNWRLRDPAEKIAYIKKQMVALEAEVEMVRGRMSP